MTLQRTLVRKRLLAACHLLKESNLSVKEIAARVGYRRSSSLTRTCQRELGLSPRAFREHGALPLF